MKTEFTPQYKAVALTSQGVYESIPSTNKMVAVLDRDTLYKECIERKFKVYKLYVTKVKFL